MITINRSTLLSDLYIFCQAGSGLIVGKPGVGKSYVLKQLKDSFLDKGILAVMIKIDNLFDSSDKSIQNELGIKEDWIETFKKIKISENNKAIMIFDAFDAARNGDFRNKILAQIKRAKQELESKWNIIVSVREYDASKSQKLIEIFPTSDTYSDNISCRKKYILALKDAEVISAASGNFALLQFFKEATNALKDILKIPFFLVLAEKVLSVSNASEIQDLKKLRSETQLLKIYWDKKLVGSTDHLVKEKVLLKLTKILIKEKSLNCSKQNFLDDFDSKESESFEYLRSENIIDEVSIGGSKIVFAHNIFFDYAVSALSIPSNPDAVLEFIRSDMSRPFFLRPSFIYFFTQMWYDHPELFWKFFWEFNKQQEKEVQLFTRLVLTGVISSEYNSLTELTPITERSKSEDRDSILRNFLQSIRFLRKKTSTQDVETLKHISSRLQITFLWDFTFLLDRAINDPDIDDASLVNLGMAARSFLSYILDKRKTVDKMLIDRLGARGVELVCKTYKTDVIASKALLESLFNLLKETDFDIYYFSNLSEYIKDILYYDPEFVAKVYISLFAHKETSNAETSIGSGVTMNVRSNRRQDFEMCHYRLTEFYPTFLEAAPEYAIPLGLSIVNDYVVKDRQWFHAEPTIQHFSFKGEDRVFFHDLSSIWSDNLYNNKPAQIVNKIGEYFAMLLKDSKAGNLIKCLNLFLNHAKAGYSWKVLISFGTTAVNSFRDFFFDFCIAEIFLTASDTSYEVGQLIEKGAPHFTNDQIKQIEKIIFDISDKYENGNDLYFQKKFLSRLPFDKLQLDNSKELIHKYGSVDNEKAYQSFSSIEPYTTEIWLQSKGVDINDPTNSELLISASELKIFNDRWLNGTPGYEEYAPYITKAYKLFKKLKAIVANINSDVAYSVLSDISQTFAIISLDTANLGSSEFDMLKEVLVYCYHYVSEQDKDNNDASPSTGYSPTPRIIASEGLGQIAARDNSTDNIELLEDAVNNSNGIIRFQAIKYAHLIAKSQPDKFDQMVNARLEKESDALIASMVLQSVPSSPYNERAANILLKTCMRKEPLFKWNNSFLDSFTLRAIWLYTTHKNQLADKILADAYQREEFCRTVIFKAFEDFRISSLKPYSNSEFFIESTIKWTLNYLTQIGNLLMELPASEFNKGNATVKSSLGIIDLIVQRIFFVFETGHHGKRRVVNIAEENRRYLYEKIKPIFEKIMLVSADIPGGGIIVGHTAHYFIQTLNFLLRYDAREILSMVTQVTKLSLPTGYSLDSMAIKEVVNLTEKLLADYRQLLTEDRPFKDLIELLDIYMNSGWVEALELLWKLDEIFK